MNTHTSSDLLDIIIVGAGPTGLSAALLLGRSLKQVLVIDSGKPRNAVSHAANSFFSRDGEDKQTSVPGVYAAGDTVSLFSAISIVVAEGTTAGVFINRALIAENLAVPNH